MFLGRGSWLLECVVEESCLPHGKKGTKEGSGHGVPTGSPTDCSLSEAPSSKVPRLFRDSALAGAQSLSTQVSAIISQSNHPRGSGNLESGNKSGRDVALPLGSCLLKWVFISLLSKCFQWIQAVHHCGRLWTLNYFLFTCAKNRLSCSSLLPGGSVEVCVQWPHLQCSSSHVSTLLIPPQLWKSPLLQISWE